MTMDVVPIVFNVTFVAKLTQMQIKEYECLKILYEILYEISQTL